MFHSTLHVCGKTYDQIPYNDRFCPVCNSGMSEDEFHFLLHCPKYSISREKFYNQVQHNFVDSNQLSSTELLIKLMKRKKRKKRRGDWGEKEGNACYNNPVLFTSAGAGDRKL